MKKSPLNIDLKGLNRLYRIINGDRGIRISTVNIDIEAFIYFRWRFSDVFSRSITQPIHKSTHLIGVSLRNISYVGITFKVCFISNLRRILKHNIWRCFQTGSTPVIYEWSILFLVGLTLLLSNVIIIRSSGKYILNNRLPLF